MSDQPTSGTGSASGTPAGQDVLTSLATWLGSVLDDILRVMTDAEGGPQLLAELGWAGSTPTLPAGLLARLDQQAQTGTDASAQAAESFAEVLVALGAFGDAMLGSASADASGVTALELVADAWR
jgi:hypothetical protein